MDDLVAHVDRRTEAIERALDDLDRALDPRAEAARIGEDHVHGRIVHLGRVACSVSGPGRAAALVQEALEQHEPGARNNFV